MKKFLCALIFIALMSNCVFAADFIRVGELTKLNISPEDFNNLVYGIPTAKSKEFRMKPAPDGRQTKFYDSLNALILALNKGEVDEILLPKDVANYVVRNNDTLEISAITHVFPNYLSFGFKDDEEGRKLKSLFNDAIITLENSGRLAMLKETYVTDAAFNEPEPVRPEKFDGAEIIKIAVTGDMPPIDFIAEDGIPAGFNTAVMAECAKVAKINLELVNIDATARAAALVSGRVNVVFWFQTRAGETLDVPEGIILSEPYYNWVEMYSVKLKEK